VLVAYTDCDHEPTTLEGMVRAEPGVAVVDPVDLNNGLPGQATVNTYDLVIFQDDCGLKTDDIDPVGDLLATYVDQGGVVVAHTYADEGPGSGYTPGGRWASGDYLAFTNAPNVNLNPRTLGAFDAGSPLMQGVTALSAPDWNSSPVASAGTTVVAHWADGANLVGYKGRVVGVAGHIGNEPGENPTGDWGRVDVNAVRFLGRHTLALAVSGTGAGTVTSAAAGISCGTTCSADFPYVTSVTLTAAPDSTSAFAGWGGVCGGTASTCTVSVDAAKSATASFTRVKGTASASFRSRTVRISLRSGKGKLNVSCANVPADVCAMALTLKASAGRPHGTSIARTVKVGSAKGTVPGGQSRKLTLKLTRKGRAVLKHAKHHKLRVTLSGTSKNRAGTTTKLKSRKLTLRAR
jgi:hypothetical protein